MPDLVVIYDPNTEWGAIIDMDEDRAMGPISPGPNAKGELQQFIDRMPEVVWTMSTYDLTMAYRQFWLQNFAALYEAAAETDPVPVVTPSRASTNDEAMATAIAYALGDGPPAPQPADTDMEVDTGETDPVEVESPSAGLPDPSPEPNGNGYEGPCFLCKGAKTVPNAVTGELERCNLCLGTGELPVREAV